MGESKVGNRLWVVKIMFLCGQRSFRSGILTLAGVAPRIEHQPVN